ncbi:MAG TPA: helix-hairpin-helix domain-containing protein [Brumimicrobium sp.]|nr:helix-hairpin-helix domain-containing protein [Brumimicrobium sp.]
MKKNWDRDWVYFSRRARRGMFVLLFFFIIIAVLPRLYYTFINPPMDFDIEIIPLTSQVDETDENESAPNSKYKQPEESFDPNLYSIEDWMEVGLSERQAQSILNYISKVGALKVASDLKKLYVVDDELYDLLKPKINLPEKMDGLLEASFKEGETESKKKADKAQQSETDEDTRNKIYRKISVNTASVAELQTVRGIGNFFANEIVKLRGYYGGLVHPTQLLSIYNLDEEKLEELKLYLEFDETEVDKININIATYEILSKHPLISSDIAHWMIYYRENYGEFKALDNLLLCPYITPKLLKELTPYLKVE